MGFRGAGGGVAEHRLMASSTAGEIPLPLGGFLVGLGPGEAEDVGEHPLGQAVAPHDALGQARPVGGQLDLPAMVTRDSVSSRRIISETAGRDTPAARRCGPG